MTFFVGFNSAWKWQFSGSHFSLDSLCRLSWGQHSVWRNPLGPSTAIPVAAQSAQKNFRPANLRGSRWYSFPRAKSSKLQRFYTQRHSTYKKIRIQLHTAYGYHGTCVLRLFWLPGNQLLRCLQVRCLISFEQFLSFKLSRIIKTEFLLTIS